MEVKMKTKKLSKKLLLEKRTIANLDKNAMGNLNGGDATHNPCTGDHTYCTCPISCSPCGPTDLRCTYDERICKTEL